MTDKEFLTSGNYILKYLSADHQEIGVSWILIPHNVEVRYGQAKAKKLLTGSAFPALLLNFSVAKILVLQIQYVANNP